MACALGARDAASVQALRKYAIAQGGRADATILGTAEKVPAGLAALVNGTMVRYLDANDIFVLSRGGASGHFSDGTAGLLALAEQYRRSGEELLTCLVASYELQGALAESLNFWERGLHPLTNVAWVCADRRRPSRRRDACRSRARVRSLRCNRHRAEYLDQTGRDHSDDQECCGRVGFAAHARGGRVGCAWA